jgi:uncharacterized protein YbjT (DUF2867 family)
LTAALPHALVLGASGYVGSNLVPTLAARGFAVRAASRRLDALQARGWRDVELVAADALDAASLDAALQGIDVAFYLVHSMAAGAGFPVLDRNAATRFRDAAARAGVQRIVYLGGLQPGGGTSTHLASRGETGDILRAGPVPVTELRAGVIIGPGSAAFEIIRDLVFHLPAMVRPRWVSSRSQPIALADVLEDLVQLAQLPQAAGMIYDAGGPEVLTYRDMMQQFGELVGRRPLIVPVPVLTPKLSSYWLDLVTAVPTNVARALIDGLAHDVLADDTALRALLPRTLMTYRDAAKAAFEAERDAFAVVEGMAPANPPEAPAGAPTPAPEPTGTGRWTEGSMLYRRNRPDFAFYAKHMRGEAVAAAPASALWDVVSAIGGDNGYYFLDALWKLRGRLDQFAGGSGMTRGRRDPVDLKIGDVIDFWRVVALEPGHRLTLIAEMRLPGSASLGFEVHALSERRSRVVVTASFHPAGIKGLMYWHALTPAHALIFPGLSREIARRAELVRPAR